MDFSKIKNFIKNHGDTFIILEDGEPGFVVMSYQDYEKMVTQNLERDVRQEWADYTIRVPVPATSPVKDFPRRRDTGDFTEGEFQETEFFASGNNESSRQPLRLEDIRLEDLPI